MLNLLTEPSIKHVQINMILTITLILSSLVVLNFLLLIFSCNKTTKTVAEKHKTLKKVEQEPTLVSNQLKRPQLAATGS